MKRTAKRLLLPSLLLLFLVCCGVYLADEGYKADPSALAVLARSDETVQITQEDSLILFMPQTPRAGLIFYPGGKVQPEAYAPLMRACAERGMLCVLVKMPGNLAVLKPNAADGIVSRYPQISSWAIGGHSLGGAMAASYASKHADDLDALILLAAYSASRISDTSLRVLSLYGTEDGVMNRESYQKYRSNLPANFTEFILEGGCHAYFGCYGAQKGDGVPTITNKAQIEQTAEQIAHFLQLEP